MAEHEPISMKQFIQILVCLFISFQYYGKQLQVGLNKEFTSIKKAIEVADNNDTVYVYSGHYKEGNIVIKKSIKLIGKGLPILDGEKKGEVLSIKANYVLVSGFKIQKSGFASLNDPCGVKVYDSHHVIIERNIFDDNFFGIYLQYSKHCVVKNNKQNKTKIVSTILNSNIPPP